MEENRLVSMLSGDLDWIVMKAMEKDRDLRYETANTLAMDIEHFLNDEPVAARPPSRIYRLNKLVRRNKAVFALITLVALTISIGFGTSSWLFLKEREAHRRAIIAEQAQTALRMQAEDRERVAQAAYLLSQNKISEADKMVDAVVTLNPSLEAESVLRTLGEWHALNGRWELAAKRFNLLLKVDIKDESWAITDDLLMAGPIMIEQGDREGYEEFRRAAIPRYLGTTDPVFAERTMKIGLLLPADEEIMQQLRTFVPVANQNTQRSIIDSMTSWALHLAGHDGVTGITSSKMLSPGANTAATSGNRSPPATRWPMWSRPWLITKWAKRMQQSNIWSPDVQPLKTNSDQA